MEPLRSAEKPRKSSCLFANCVAKLVVQTYRQTCPQDLQDAYAQTVLSGIVLHLPHQPVGQRLRCVALATGTKVLAAERIDTERACGEARSKGDSALRDMHAEVLTRRAFVRFVLLSIATNTCSDFLTPEDASMGRWRWRAGVTVHLYASSMPCGNACIKRWIKGSTTVTEQELSEDVWPQTVHNTINLTHVKEGQVSALMKSNRGRHRSEMNSEVATDTVERRIDLHQSSKTDDSFMCHYTTTDTSNDKHELKKAEPPRDSSLLPLGVSWPSHDSKGSVLSCSDKLLQWNAIGLQSAFLLPFLAPTLPPSPSSAATSLLESTTPSSSLPLPSTTCMNDNLSPRTSTATAIEPTLASTPASTPSTATKKRDKKRKEATVVLQSPAIYLSSIIVGRKSSIPHAQRAFCCRLATFRYAFCLPSSSSVSTSSTMPREATSMRKHSSGPVVVEGGQLMDGGDKQPPKKARIGTNIDDDNSTADAPQQQHADQHRYPQHDIGYAMQHPAMLTTAVNLYDNESATDSQQPLPQPQQQQRAISCLQGAVFRESRCFVAYLKTQTLAEASVECAYDVEVIDGRTGYLYDSEAASEPSIANSAAEKDTIAPPTAERASAATASSTEPPTSVQPREGTRQQAMSQLSSRSLLYLAETLVARELDTDDAATYLHQMSYRERKHRLGSISTLPNRVSNTQLNRTAALSQYHAAKQRLRYDPTHRHVLTPFYAPRHQLQESAS